MSSGLIDLLNSAASNDPNTVVAAGQQLLLFTASCDPKERVYEKLAIAVFNPENSSLTPNGRFVGLIHLKNALFDPQIWKNLVSSERSSVRYLLLNYLASGSDPSRMINAIEVMPQIGPCLATLMARLVHNDWLKEEWSDEIWEQLINACAWSSLRSGLRAAAGFRLPARRKVFLELIQTLLPTVLNLWQTSSMNLRQATLDPAIRLSRLLYTCLTAPSLQPKSGPYLLDSAALPVATRIFDQSFAVLNKLYSLGSDSCWTAEHAQFARRLTKLILAATMVSNPEVRGKSINMLFLHTTEILSKQAVRPLLDKKAMTWILALVYGLLSSKACDSGAQLPLDTSGSSELQKCLFSPASSTVSDTLLFVLVRNLIHTSFSLSPVEILGITSNPESCMAAGGSCITMADADVATNVSAATIWDVDVQAQDLIRVNLESLLGLHGAEQHVACFQSCRQLSELVVTQLLRCYETKARSLLLHLLEVSSFIFLMTYK
ncbi:unnamed protein product [Echinostoma caproni]|uniref:Importin N-terminal domain-containing protein n=1 Tax=Echinostoma caproni TaxID=27848 RepID=A0A183B4M8_9TREM|nr:unnamed protein product [Echinostoma caproni]